LETLNCIATRRSVRKYKDIPLEFEKIGKILDAGRLAPSAGNLQDWKFILITEEETRKKIAEACLKQYWMQDAPVHIVVVSHPKRVARFYGDKGEKIYNLHNAAAAIQNMLLAAIDQGLGCCWVGAFEEGMLRQALSIPDSAMPQAVLTFGYADEKPPRPPKYTIENVTYIESYGSKVKDIAAYRGYYSEHVQRVIKKGREMVRKILDKKS
jgi:nitroreductase